MTANDFHALVNIGDSISIVLDGEKIVGQVSNILEETVVITRADNNKRLVKSISSIEAFEISSDTPEVGITKNGGTGGGHNAALARIEAARKTIVPQKLPLPEIREDTVNFVYRDQRDIQKRVDRLANKCKSAVKNHALAQKCGEIRQMTARMRNDYPNEHTLRAFMGDIEALCENYTQAAEDYLTGQDFPAALAAAQADGDGALLLRCAAACLRQCVPVPAEAIRQLFYTSVQRQEKIFAVETVRAMPPTQVEREQALFFDGLLTLLGAVDLPYAIELATLPSDRSGIEALMKKLSELLPAASVESDLQSADPTKHNEQVTSSLSTKTAVNALPRTYMPPVPGARSGEIISFLPRESIDDSFGFISGQNENGGQEEYYFSYSQVEDVALRVELAQAKVLRRNWKISFTSVPSNHGSDRADHIRLEKEDAAVLSQMATPIVEQGTLRSGNSFRDADGKVYSFTRKVIRDEYLKLYLRQPGFVEKIPLRFISDPAGNHIACAVWLPQEEFDRLAEINLGELDERRENNAWLLSLALNSPVPTVPGDYIPLSRFVNCWGTSTPFSAPLPSVRPKTTALVTEREEINQPQAKRLQAKRANDAAPIPAVGNQASVPKPKSREISTLEEERTELEGLLAQAEQYFANFKFPSTSPGNDFYQLGVEEKQKREFKRAESYLYKAIVYGQRPEEAFAALMPTYLRGKDLEEGKLLAARGLFILEKYRNLCTPERYRTNRINLLEKSGFDTLLVEELHTALPIMLRPSTRMHYCSRAGHILLSRGQYEQAAQYFEQWEAIRQDNAAVLGIADGQNSKYALAQKDVEQCLAVCYNMLGRDEKAREIADKLLRDDQNNFVAKQIVEGTLDAQTAQKAGLSDEDTYDYIEEGKIEPPPYAKYCLENAEMQQVRKGRVNLSGKINGNTYCGTPEEAKQDVDELSKNNFMNRLTSAQRKDYWAMAAQIIAQTMQAYRSEENRLTQNYLRPDRVWEKIAHSILSEADDTSQSPGSNLDIARFLYMESIPLFLEKNSDREGAFSRMLGTVLLSREDLRGLTGESSGFLAPFPDWLRNCEEVSKARDLLLCSFLLDEKYCMAARKGGNDSVGGRKNHMEVLRKGLYGNQLLRKEVKTAFDKLAVVHSERPNPEDAFNEDWRKAKAIYLQKRDELIECIHRCVEDMDHPQRLTEDMEKIGQFWQMDLLFSSDKDRLKEFCSVVLEPLIRLQSKDSFEQRSDDYKNVRLACERMIRSIYAAPTKISFDELRGALESIAGSVNNALDRLYQASAPVLSLELAANAAYVDEKNPSPRIEVEVKNKINMQPALLKNLEVTVLGGKGGDARSLGRLKAEVRGSEQVSQEWSIALRPEQLEDRYFDIEVKLTYTYFSKVHQEETGVSRAKFNLSLADASEFEEIKNLYTAIREGSGVDDSMFFGRDEYIRELISSLRLSSGDMLCRRGIVMYGQKRAGKTAILDHLTARIVAVYGRDTYIVIHVGSVGAVSNIVGFFERIMDKLELTLQDDHRQLYDQLVERGIDFKVDEIGSQQSPARAQTLFLRAFSRIDRALQELGGTQKYIPMFLLDEFTYFYDWIVSGAVDPSFMLFWKAFHQEYRVCTISVAMDSMPEFVSYTPPNAAGNFTNSFGCLKLQPVGYLDRKSTKELADKSTRLSGGQSRFQDEALDYIYDLTAGSAYLAVILCDELVKYVNDNKTVRISRTVIDLVLENRLFRGRAIKDENFDPQLNDPGVFDPDNRPVQRDNVELLTHVALNCGKKGHELSRTELSGCLGKLSQQTEERIDYLIDRLVRRDVLERRASNNVYSYKIKVDLLRKWLLYKSGVEE